MNARVFLLVIACSMFMGIWNSDQQAMNAALARKQRASTQSSVASLPLQMFGDDIDAVPKKPPVHSKVIEAPSNCNVEIDTTAESTVVFTLLIQSVPSMSLSMPFAIEAAEEELLSSSTELVGISDPVLTNNGVSESPASVDEVVVTEIEDGEVDAQLDSYFVFETPESLTPASDSVSIDGQSVPESTESLAEPSVPSAEELAIVVAPSLLPSDKKMETAKPSEVVSLNLQEVAPSILPLESTGPIVPLPQNLASGTWTVMNQSGDTFKVTIERSSNANAKGAQESFEQNFCLKKTTDGDRWCFIRSFSDLSDLSNPEKSTSPRQASTEFFSPLR